MDRVELLTVEDCFQIEGFGLVLRPDFSVPNGRWAEVTEPVIVVRPDGEKFETAARFGLSHFRISDPAVSIDRRWRVVLSFPNAAKDLVPVGSKILVSHEMRDALLGTQPG
jgi:hypothetical protein